MVVVLDWVVGIHGGCFWCCRWWRRRFGVGLWMLWSWVWMASAMGLYYLTVGVVMVVVIVGHGGCVFVLVGAVGGRCGRGL